MTSREGGRKSGREKERLTMASERMLVKQAAATWL